MIIAITTHRTPRFSTIPNSTENITRQTTVENIAAHMVNFTFPAARRLLERGKAQGASRALNRLCRTISRMISCRVSSLSPHHTVKVVDAAESKCIHWPLGGISNEELEHHLFPNKHQESSCHVEPDYAYPQLPSASIDKP